MAVLAFFISPLGRYFAIALVFLAACWASNIAGRWEERAVCRAAALQSRIDAMERDAEAANQAAKAAEHALAELAEISATDKQRIDEYEAELAKRPGACLLDDGDLRVLNNKPNNK